MKGEKMDRRSFIGVAGVAAAATALTGLVGCAAADEKPKEEKQAEVETTEKNRVCEVLGIEKPVLSASMAWGTSPELVAAVSNAGGLGILGLYPDKVEYPDGVDESTLGTIEKTKYAIQHTKKLTDKPFAVTFGQVKRVQGADIYDFLDMVKEEGVNIFYYYGMGCAENGRIVDTENLELLKEEGFTVIYRDVCPTLDTIKQAQDTGVDIIACSGYGQGGHITDTRMTNLTLMVEARPIITVPMIANGLIVDAETAKAAALLGAEGCIVGTRFNASKEGPYADPFKQAIVDAKSEDVVEWRASIGFWHSTPCEVADQCVALDKAGAERSEISAIYCGNDARHEQIYGTDVKKYGISINDSVDRITSIKTCQEIVDEIGSAWV